MKNFLLPFFVGIASLLQAQSFNNEWIDYSKTYYKFKITSNKLHRITQTSLNSVGLSGTLSEHFQLYRNGVQVPIFTSIPTGIFGATDYIEFWGVPNDGEPDTDLYNNAANHFNKKWSLINDTATYYLTVNTNISQNKRLQNVTNNVAANLLTVEKNFMFTIGNYPKNKINNGFAALVGEPLHASSFDKGEGWSTNDIYGNGSYTNLMTNLFPDLTATTSATYKIGAVGNALNQRSLINYINGNTVLSTSLNFFEPIEMTSNFPVSFLNSGNANIVVNNSCPNGSDKMVIANQEITYPRLFNFGGQKNFEFCMDANAAGNYLEIVNFNAGSSIPVLYDLTNEKRYVAIVDGTTLKFALEGSTVKRNLVLVSQNNAEIVNINTIESKTFFDYTAITNQGDYLIITSKVLHTSNDVNNAVEKYKAYRNTVNGGGYNVKIVDVEDLYDQYSFGINKHPNAVRHFLRKARTVFVNPLKYVLIIGRGVSYNEAKINEAELYINMLNLVPTFGYPASDNLLTADPGTFVQKTPIGRLGVINNNEIEDYLNKVKDYEQKQRDPNFTISNKAWMKKALFVTGSSEPYLQTVLDNYQLEYMNSWGDTTIGGKSHLFTKSQAGGPIPLTNSFMEQSWNEGHSFLEYFGHSSASALEFNLDDPSIYNNQGKYPVMMINGCNAGNYFVYNPFRITTNTNQSLSEKFVFAPNKGSIGFIASTSYGIVNYLHYYNSILQKTISGSHYGQSIGNIMQETSNKVLVLTGQNDYYAQMQSEQILLQGDPAITLNVQYPKPDYVIESHSLTTNSDFISVADDSFKINMYYMNLGKSLNNDSINIKVSREFPNGNIKIIYNKRVAGTRFVDTMNFAFRIMPNLDFGLNKITIQIDADNERSEMSETNNIITKNIFIHENEARPIFPYNYAIVNTLPLKLAASTANPLAVGRNYFMELDTTTFFNSPIKQTQTITQVGGVLEFAPINSLLTNKVYYWKIAAEGNNPLHWNTFSFTYLPGSTHGYNQGHLYQHLNSNYDKIILDSTTRKFIFDSVGVNVSIRNAVWPWGNEESHYTISLNQDPYIRGLCELNSITFNVFDPKNAKPWVNVGGQFGSSGNVCVAGSQYNFTYHPHSLSQRNAIDNFLRNNVPNGYYVSVRNFNFYADPINAASNWAGDAVANGNGQSMYNTLKNAGFTKIDDVTSNNAFIFIYKKNEPSFTPKQVVGLDEIERVSATATFTIPDTLGFITSPKFGPAKEWKEIHWRGTAFENVANLGNNGDNPKVIVFGVNHQNVESQLFELDTLQKDYDISTINAIQYPFIKLKLVNQDGINASPWQLDYWRLNYVPSPEGAVAPNIQFQLKDTFEFAEPIQSILAFKNISNVAFDSVRVKVMVLDSNNLLINTHILPKQKNVGANDTIKVMYTIPNISLAGRYTLLFDINPDNDQPEQTHFNNLLYKSIFVKLNVLPVNWLRVQAVLQGEKSLVTWSTSTEVNTKHFEIEHSMDGRNYVKLGTISAVGNSSIVTNYSYDHLQPLNGINYYRVKQVDNDGSFEYSRIVSVLKRVNKGQTFVGPIPAKDFLNIFETAPTFVRYAEIYDLNGSLVTRLTINSIISSTVIPLTGLQSSSYVLKIVYQGEQKSYKFIKN